MKIRAPRHKLKISGLDPASSATVKARAPASTIIVVGLLLTTVTGCSGQTPGSTGDLESSRIDRTQKELSTVEEPSDAPEEDTAQRSPDQDPASESGGESSVTEGSGAGDNAEESSGRPPTGSADDPLVVVNNEYGLSPEYVPGDLEPLHPLGIKTLGGGEMRLRQEAARAASKMISDAAAEGIELVVCSAYRSYEAQMVSYGRMTSIYGEEAESLVAEPGYSEHQLGTTIDVSNASTGYRLVKQFGETQAYRWLGENAVEYGFVLSYPRTSEETAGYQWEPWHYRYIGPEKALTYAKSHHESPQSFFLEEGVLPESSEDKG